MGLVGMDHHDLAGAAGAQLAAIVEGLRAPQGQADRIGLVAVQVVGMAAEPRRQALQAGAGLLEADLVGEASCTNVQDGRPILPDMGRMIYETKTALVLRKRPRRLADGQCRGLPGRRPGRHACPSDGRALQGRVAARLHRPDPRAGVRLRRHASRSCAAPTSAPCRASWCRRSISRRCSTPPTTPTTAPPSRPRRPTRSTSSASASMARAR